MTTGQRIKELRIEKGLTQTELGEKVNISNKTISKYEKGSVEPSMTMLAEFAEIFGVSTDYILGISSDRNSDTKKYDVDKTISKIGIPVGARVPIVGVIRAGLPIFAEENIEGWEFTSLSNPNEYFYLRVTGDSMIGAGIQEGALALIHKQDYANNGQIVACMVDEENATLKRFRQHGDTVMLMPANDNYEPIILDASEFNPDNGRARIIGVLKAVTMQFD